VLLAVVRLLLRRIVVHLLLLDLHRDHDVNYTIIRDSGSFSIYL
jgi:hypothetical protein